MTAPIAKRPTNYPALVQVKVGSATKKSLESSARQHKATMPVLLRSILEDWLKGQGKKVG